MRNLSTVCVFFLIHGFLMGQQSISDFVITINTTYPGQSSDSSFTISVASGLNYNFSIDWNNDGVFDDNNLVSAITHSYPSPGFKTIRIRGAYPYPSFRADKEKLVSIDQWGDIAWQSMIRGFSECDSLLTAPLDTPNFSQAPNLADMFYGCEKFNGPVNHWDVSNIRFMTYIFAETNSFNQPLNDWDVSSVQQLVGAFSGSKAFNQPLNNWNTTSLTAAMSVFLNAESFDQNIGNWDISLIRGFGLTDIVSSSGLSPANYDSTIIGWYSQAKPTNISIQSSGMTYCASIRERNALINNDGWTFTGDSLASPCLVDLQEEEDSESSFSFFPNPTSGQIEIQGIQDHLIKAVNLRSISGQLIESFSFEASQFPRLEIDAPPAVYLLEVVKGDGSRIHRKLIKN